MFVSSLWGASQGPEKFQHQNQPMIARKLLKGWGMLAAHFNYPALSHRLS